MTRVQVATEPTQLEIKELVENIDAFAGVTSDPNGVKYRPIMDPILRIGYEERTLESIIQDVYDANLIVDKATDITGFQLLPLDNQEIYLVFGLQFISIINTKTMTLLEHQRVINNGYIAFASTYNCRFFFDNRFLYVAVRQGSDTGGNGYVIGFMVFDKTTLKYKTTTEFKPIGINIGNGNATQLSGMSKNSSTWFVITSVSSASNWYFSKITFGTDGLPISHTAVSNLPILNQSGSGNTVMGLPSYQASQIYLIERSGTYAVVRHVDINESNNLASVIKLLQYPIGTFSPSSFNPFYTREVNGKRWWFLMFTQFTFMYNETDGVAGSMIGGGSTSIFDLDTLIMRVKDIKLYLKSDSQVVRMDKYICDLDNIYTSGGQLYITPIRQYPEFMLFDSVDSTTLSGWTTNPNIDRSYRINGVLYLFDPSLGVHFPLLDGYIINSYEEVKYMECVY